MAAPYYLDEGSRPQEAGADPEAAEVGFPGRAPFPGGIVPGRLLRGARVFSLRKGRPEYARKGVGACPGNGCPQPQDPSAAAAFAEVFSAARRSGGDLAAIVRSAADTIGAKIEVTEEIEASLAARKSEQQIMSLMPCLILLYLRIASPGFLDVLYGNVAGACVMTCALAVYLLCVRAGNRIVEVGI